MTLIPIVGVAAWKAGRLDAALERIGGQDPGGVPVAAPLILLSLLFLAGELPAVDAHPVEQVQHPRLALGEILSQLGTGSVPQNRPLTILVARIQGDRELRVLPD